MIFLLQEIRLYTTALFVLNIYPQVKNNLCRTIRASYPCPGL